MDAYVINFDQYLKYTREKEILAQSILEEMKKHSVKTVLDIGAGGGELSALLSKGISRYMAVEKRPAYAQRLRAGGLDTFEGDFYDFHSPEKFDLVLISWALDSNKDRFRAFLQKASDFVSPKGILILITYEDAPDPWDWLIKAIGFPPYEMDRMDFGELKKYLSTLGRLHASVITIPVVTKTQEELIQSLAFVASGGFQDRKDLFLKHRQEITSILEREYRTASGYAFPFYHQFLVVEKE